MKKKIKRIAVGLALAVIMSAGSPAGAAFYIDRSGQGAASAPAMQAAAETPAVAGGLAAGVVHRGAHPTTIPPAIGMGRDVPLALAVSQIAPDGWYVHIAPEHADRPVSWQGAESWPGALSKMMETVHGQAVIDWDQKVIKVFVGPQQPVEEPKLVRERDWKIEVGDRYLAHTFTRWAADWKAVSGEDWTIVWDAPKHIAIGVTALVHGSIESAITDTLHSLLGEEFQLEAWAYENGPKSYAVRIVPLNAKKTGGGKQ